MLLHDLGPNIALFVAGLAAGLFWRRRIWPLIAMAFVAGLIVALFQFDDWASVRHDITNFAEFLTSCGMLLLFFAFWYIPGILGVLLGSVSRVLFNKS